MIWGRSLPPALDVGATRLGADCEGRAGGALRNAQRERRREADQSGSEKSSGDAGPVATHEPSSERPLCYRRQLTYHGRRKARRISRHPFIGDPADSAIRFEFYTPPVSPAPYPAPSGEADGAPMMRLPPREPLPYAPSAHDYRHPAWHLMYGYRCPVCLHKHHSRPRLAHYLSWPASFCLPTFVQVYPSSTRLGIRASARYDSLHNPNAHVRHPRLDHTTSTHRAPDLPPGATTDAAITHATPCLNAHDKQRLSSSFTPSTPATSSLQP